MPQPASESAVITAVDFLESQKSLERAAADLLPFKFDRCTLALPEAEVDAKQMLFACRACAANLGGGAMRGMCYSCSIECHADCADNDDGTAEVVLEVGARRLFSCDCGAGRMPRPCRLTAIPVASAVASPNAYDHNFEGRFCWCDKEYDPEDESVGALDQCAVCEDWFHDACIGLQAANDGAGGEGDTNNPDGDFICKVCVAAKVPWLLRYLGRIARGVEGHEEESAEPESTGSSCDDVFKKRPLSVDGSRGPPIAKRARADVDLASACMWKDLPDRTNMKTPSIFLSENWRGSICRCLECLERFEVAGVAFLGKPEDTYKPPRDEESDMSLFDIGLQKMTEMDRTKAITGLMAYEKMRDEIKAFLEPFAASGKVVTEQDLAGFTHAMQAKRQHKAV